MFKWRRRANHSDDKGQGSVRPFTALVQVTGGPSDSVVVRLACELLESRKSTLHLLYVIEVARDTPLDAVVARDSHAGEQALEDMERIARRYNCIIDAHLVQARDVGTAVVREAIDKNVETIVIGTSVTDLYGRYSLEQHIPYILRHSPCRVILSREPAQVGSGLTRHASRARTV